MKTADLWLVLAFAVAIALAMAPAAAAAVDGFVHTFRFAEVYTTTGLHLRSCTEIDSVRTSGFARPCHHRNWSNAARQW